MKRPLSLYELVSEPEGHALGMAIYPGSSLAIAIACSCGYEDTWLPHHRVQVVAVAFNRHLTKEGK